MSALIDSNRREPYADIAFVFANRADAAGLGIAAEHGIDTLTIDHRKHASRGAFDEAIDRELRARRIDIVALAGFMRILDDPFVARWQGRLINIHPSLLPSFPGLRVHEQALAAGVTISGATVHFVIPKVDAGPAIGQAAVPVLGGDTPETLAARILEAEHLLYPRCLKMLCRGEVRLEGGRAVFKDGPVALFLPS